MFDNHPNSVTDFFPVKRGKIPIESLWIQPLQFHHEENPDKYAVKKTLKQNQNAVISVQYE